MADIDCFKQSLGARVKYLRENFRNGKLSLAELADFLPSVSRANLGRIENGEVMPSAKFIEEVSSFFKVSANWLLTGKEFDIQTALDPDLQKIIEAFNRLDEDNRHALKTYAAFLLSHKRPDVLETVLNETRAPVPAPEPDSVKEEKSVYLPLLGNAAAGMPIMAEELLEGFVPVPATKVKKNTYLIKAKGNSMIEADIKDGDLVIVTPQPVVENGEIALVKIDGDVTIKKFYRHDHGVKLKPANSTMKDIVVTDLAKIKILGKVIGVIPAEEARLNMREEFNGPNE